MSDSRAQTLATLDAFLESQRQLLARTQSDLHKLARLRERALADPETFLENADAELDDPAFKLSEYEPPERPEGIDWSLFTSLDPSPFAAIPIPGPGDASTATKQLSPPSELQTFVREASRTLLADFRPFVPSESEDGQDADADAADGQRLAELVSCGKRRRVGPGLRPKHAHVQDRGKIHVDSASQAPPQVRIRSQRVRRPTIRADEIYQSQAQLHTQASPAPAGVPSILSSSPSRSTTSSAASQPSPRLNATFESDVPKPVKYAESASPEGLSRSRSFNDGGDGDGDGGDGSANQDGHNGSSSTGTQHDATSKQKGRNPPSGTFNLPWSLAEQHLLEKLLVEIPAGEKRRWAKISKAMAGKRTPRQVASRVQKYFEKLKKFGVEPG